MHKGDDDDDNNNKGDNNNNKGKVNNKGDDNNNKKDIIIIIIIIIITCIRSKLTPDILSLQPTYMLLITPRLNDESYYRMVLIFLLWEL